LPDIDDAEIEIDRMGGVENSWCGRVLVKLVRAVRFAHGRIVVVNNKVDALEQRTTAAEARLTVLENPPPE
jgi:hypothetical protein